VVTFGYCAPLGSGGGQFIKTFSGSWGDHNAGAGIGRLLEFGVARCLLGHWRDGLDCLDSHFIIGIFLGKRLGCRDALRFCIGASARREAGTL